MTKTIVAVFHHDSLYSARKDVLFGEKVLTASQNLKGRPPKPQVIRAGTHVSSLSWIIGQDTHEATQVYVVSEHSGRRVYGDLPASQADLDALVEVLRGHGYTCRRTTGGAA